MLGGILERLGRGQMPLADHAGRIAAGAQLLCYGRGVERQAGAVAGHVHPVRVAAGDQRGARRAAARHIVEIVEAHRAPGHRIEVRRVDIAAIRTEVRIADIVAHDHDQVGPLVAPFRPGERLPSAERRRGHRAERKPAPDRLAAVHAHGLVTHHGLRTGRGARRVQSFSGGSGRPSSGPASRRGLPATGWSSFCPARQAASLPRSVLSVAA